LFIDEVDAFPYSGSAYFARLTNKAIKPKGIIIMISATLEENTKVILEKRNYRFFLVPERFHQIDHDLPRFRQVNTNDHDSMVKELLTISRQWINSGKIGIVFVPTVKDATIFASLLRKNNVRAFAFSTQTNNKEGILARFKERSIDILVATTILERGVTFLHVQVAILFADDPLYTASTLIQMSGRVGRSNQDPHGEIWFLSVHISKAMREAYAKIKYWNKLNHKG
jgi:competence protein ComFA